MASEPEYVIREATTDDVPAILGLIRDLARFERAEDEVEATEQGLIDALFGESAVVFADVVVAEQEVVATAIWYKTFSTWTGRCGIHLEDLYVVERHRRRGIASALLQRLAARTTAEGWARLEWKVLDWNVAAIEFYEGLGGKALREWTTYRLSGQALGDLAGQWSNDVAC